MTSLEDRIARIEDIQALEDILFQYYDAVDTLTDIDALVDAFTPDAMFDLEGLGLATCRGQDEIRKFFSGVFRDTEYNCHHVTNFHVRRLDGDQATARGYVIGKARGTAGDECFVHCCYEIDYVRTANGWKISRFDEDSLTPLDGSMEALHGEHLG